MAVLALVTWTIAFYVGQVAEVVGASEVADLNPVLMVLMLVFGPAWIFVVYGVFIPTALVAVVVGLLRIHDTVIGHALLAAGAATHGVWWPLLDGGNFWPIEPATLDVAGLAYPVLLLLACVRFLRPTGR